jgi:hypothetical protein
MIFSVINLILLLFPLLIHSFDDYPENLSVNTGESATFICDLPERYSNKPVRPFCLFMSSIIFFYL